MILRADRRHRGRAHRLTSEATGAANWDYRFTWLRDALLTLFASFSFGLHEEADGFFGWLRTTGIGEGGRFQKPLPGRRRHPGRRGGARPLSGYRRSAPVRIGNGAVDQLQLDVYGELLDSAYLYARFGGEISQTLWKELHAVVDMAIECWQLARRLHLESRGGCSTTPTAR